MGGKVEDAIDNVVDTVKDIVEPVTEPVVDFIEDTADVVVDFIEEDVYGDILRPTFEVAIDFTHKFAEEVALKPIDKALEAVGISGSMNLLYNLNDGLAWIEKGILRGNWQAIKAGAMIAVAIVVTIVTWSPYALANEIGAVIALSQSGAYALIAIQYALLLSSVYGIAVSIATIGKYINNPYSLIAKLQQIRDSMNLAYVNGFINGTMNMWMAGGVLYDSPRAGDVMFKIDGHLGTTRFLNLEDKNQSVFHDWVNNKYHEFAKKSYGQLAGDEFFGISPLAR